MGASSSPDSAQRGWTPQERRRVTAIALAPLFLPLAGGALSTPWAGADGLVLAACLIPAAYLTLIFFVLPLQWVRRRLGWTGTGAVSLTAALATFLPWWAAYAMLFPSDGARWAGGPGMVAALLLVPAFLAALVAMLIDRSHCGRR